MINFKVRKYVLVLSLILVFVGGMTMANAQEKPPLLGIPSGPVYGQTPPPAGQIPPPPPPAGHITPPPSGGPLSGIQQNLLRNAKNAVATAKRVKAYLTPGNVWVAIGPGGEKKVKAAITYEGVAVAVLHFDPQSGILLPLGVHPKTFGVNPPMESIKHNLASIVSKLEVLNGAEYRERENVWIVPLAYEGMIVAHLKIYMDGIHVVPDYPADQEMRIYGK